MTHTYTETNEERLVRLINEAKDQAMKIKGVSPSRENSSVITKLDEAGFWASADIDEKGGVASS